jgi:hypothetical protein
MWDRIQHLAAQQTTPPELATFLFLVTVACILAAALIYGGIMTAAWLISLRTQLRWREVVFPDLPRLKRLTWEYALAGLTSLVLALTLAEKDALVDRVLDQDAQRFFGTHLFASLFPLHRVPDRSDLHGHLFLDEIQKQGTVKLGSLVRGPLEAGREGEVHALITAATRDVLGSHPGLEAPLTRWLTVACVLLILAYLAWLTRGRIRDLRAAAANVDSPYKDVAGRLAVLGVCLALLLATPVITRDADLLADAAMAAARRAPATPQTRAVDSIIGAGIEAQSEALAGGMSGDALARRALAEDRARIDTIVGRLRAHDDSLARLAGQLVQVVRLARFDSLAVDSLGRRNLLLVQTAYGAPATVSAGTPPSRAAFAARAASRPLAIDTTAGLHQLPQGTYTVTSLGMSRTVSLGTGEVVTVSFVQRIP